MEVEIFSGQGSYVAGEETAMLESMQGRPAMPRQKPPFYPTDFGLYGKPTLVNNVETLCNIPRILSKGASWFAEVGTERCPGTMRVRDQRGSCPSGLQILQRDQVGADGRNMF